MTRTPLPCGWTPDPAATALRRMDAAAVEFVTAWRATDDPDLLAAANDAFTAALDAIEADLPTTRRTR